MTMDATEVGAWMWDVLYTLTSLAWWWLTGGDLDA